MHGERYYMFIMLALSVAVAALAVYIVCHTVPRIWYKVVIGVSLMALSLAVPYNIDMPGPFVILFFVAVLAAAAVVLPSWKAMSNDRRELETMAYTDALSGLFNRHKMNRFFETYSGKETIAVLFLDLDRFKSINDTFGHSIGDKLTQEVTGRLKSFITGKRQVYRIGGDEFVVIAVDCQQEQAERLAEKLVRKIKQPYYLEENELHITVSIGISIGTIQSMDCSAFLHTADTAMYNAKRSGKNRYSVFNDEMRYSAERKLELETDLPRALEHKEIHTVYRPRWDVETNRLAGLEAIVQWNHPRLGLVDSAECISIAEDTGLILPLTVHMMETVCLHSQSLQRIVHPISIKLSARLLQNDNVTSAVQTVVSGMRFDPRYLEFEITEIPMTDDVSPVANQLHRIRALGIQVSLGGFGAGLTPIGLLADLPVTAVKLAPELVRELRMPGKQALLNAIVCMAGQTHLDVTAQGVDEAEQAELLRRSGCRFMQGDYFGKPMSCEQLAQWEAVAKRDGSPAVE